MFLILSEFSEGRSLVILYSLRPAINYLLSIITEPSGLINIIEPTIILTSSCPAPTDYNAFVK
jgi:hypothetical protein